MAMTPAQIAQLEMAKNNANMLKYFNNTGNTAGTAQNQAVQNQNDQNVVVARNNNDRGKTPAQQAAEAAVRNSQDVVAANNNRNVNATPSTPSKPSTPSAPAQPYLDLWKTIAEGINKSYDEQGTLAEKNRNAYYDSQAKLREQYLKGQADLRDAWRTQQAGNRQTFLDTQDKSRESDIARSNEGYDKSAKQNYINYMQALKGLASQLNALGVRGGASESAAIRMNSNYGTNVANNEASRQQALAALRQQYEKAVADYELAYQQGLFDYDQDYSSRLASYDDSYYGNLANADKEYLQLLADLAKGRNSELTSGYADAAQKQIARDDELAEIQRQIKERAEDIAREDRIRAEDIARADKQRKEDRAYEEAIRQETLARENEAIARETKRYENEWNTSRSDKELENFANAIDGMYNNPDSYLKLIEKLKKSDDPNKQTKIMLARKALANLRDEIDEKKKLSSGGGGYGGRSYGGGGYGGYGGYGSSGSSEEDSGATNPYVQAAADMAFGIAGGLGETLGSLGAKPSDKNSKEWEKYQIPAKGGRFVG